MAKMFRQMPRPNFGIEGYSFKKTVMAIDEKRTGLRRNLTEEDRYLVEYKIAGKFFQKLEMALTLNISSTGLLFRSTKFIPSNTLLKMSMTLPRIKRQVQTLARVVRVEPTAKEGIFNVGVTFTEIPDADRQALDQYCQEKEKK